METQTRLRPNLKPVWIDRSPSGYAKPSHYSARSPMYSSALRSPGMPSPIYPTSPGYDLAMRRHERAMVDSFDQRGRSLHAEPLTARSLGRSLSPIVEQNSISRRASMAGLSPRHAPGRSPYSPGRRPMQYPRRPTLAAETRSILLSGFPDGLPATSESRATATRSVVEQRRRSLPASLPAIRRGSQQRRHELQAWGHVFFGNGTDADCFVSPVALRRPSEASSTDEASPSKETMDFAKDGHGKVTIRARVRPRALDRKPFLLQRTFDRDELRACIPESEPALEGTRRLSVDSSGRRSSELDKAPIRGISTTPIHLNYARVYFPILAALIYSTFIHTGDIIDFPLPHPEAWSQTVAHTYTGQGELTEAIRQNILYLGGKV
ncbi:hypothetical protein B0T17DRAFT_590511 [Bombardia bombarda]|uniref:Uncharacterized protein n=1 Tax=Bombardia bombarda TaxID=252184 RepID=A0AA39WZR9_9PEZI|nr:hypothetical protein B0T17DRAFT_590511 [Bombardia bombarda]